MSIKTRSLVFATFFGNCIVVGLLMASLTTDYWIIARARRHNSHNASGSVNFGLFSGWQDLNVGIGNRTSKIDVLEFIRKEPHSMSYWLWLGAFLGTGFALFSSAVGAIASVLKSASIHKKKGTMVLLLVSNSSSGEFDFSPEDRWSEYDTNTYIQPICRNFIHAVSDLKKKKKENVRNYVPWRIGW